MRETDPFRLFPACRDYVWGGNKLKADYNKAGLPCCPLAECWELSAHPAGECALYQGEKRIPLSEYLRENPGGAGEGFLPEDSFPVLVKLIDAREDLSVQVHPTDGIAGALGCPRGKTELWHILEAEPGAGIYLGLNRKVTREELSARIADGTILKILRWLPVSPGESYMVRAGELHAIGRGIVLVEVQESSDITYRAYDYGRMGADGKPRQLHIEQALRCASLSPGSYALPGASDWAKEAGWSLRHIADCPYFCVDELSLRGEFQLAADGRSFVHMLVTSGWAIVRFEGGSFPLKKGEGAFLPAGGACAIEGNAGVLLIRK